MFFFRANKRLKLQAKLNTSLKSRGLILISEQEDFKVLNKKFILSQHCDSQTWHRQKTALNLFFKAITVTHTINIKSPSKTYRSVFWNKKRTQGSEMSPQGEDQKPVP